MRKKLKKIVSIGTGLLFFALALTALQRELSTFRLKDVLEHLKSFPWQLLWLSIGLTVLNYFVLAGYECLALIHIEKRVKFKKIFWASVTVNTLGNSAAAAAVTGTALRYRLYGAFGLSLLETTQMISVTSLTFVFGFLTVTGPVLLLLPASDKIAHLPSFAGSILLIIPALYFLISLFVKEPLRFRRWQWKLPSWKIAAGQIILGSFDWLAAALVLFVLMRAAGACTYSQVLAPFMLAQLAGFLSQIPAGLGVFDAILLTTLSGTLPPDAVVTSLFMYRLIYYVIPVIVGTIMLTCGELYRHRTKVSREIN